jgi:hypothetical protein
MKYIYGVFIGQYVYVGSTKDATNRQYQHIRDLQRGTHYNHRLQAIYEGKSEFRILETTLRIPIINREQYWIDKLFKEGYKIVNLKRASPSTQTTVQPKQSKPKYKFIPLLVTWKRRAKNNP